MMSSLSVQPARGYGDLRNKIYEVEGHIREANAMKGVTAPDEARKVALMNCFI